MITTTPSIRSLQRARKNPDKVMSTVLYALAQREKTSMEENLGVPLYIAGTRIDGYCVDDNGITHCFVTDMPEKPRKTAYYVYRDGFDRYHVDRYRNMENCAEVVGIVTAYLVPTESTPKPGTFICWTW